ncbi:uncharacterized protein LOC129789271 [Lutzomyia longipalpis]|nr:uncharacterized protein LOC129789271 [Lutzomyia longipalpis]
MKIAIVFVAILALCAAEKARFDNYRVYTLKVTNEEQLKDLRMLEDQDQAYQFWDFPSVVGQDLDIMVPPHKLADIEEFTNYRGIPKQLKIQNVQELIDQENPLVQPRSFGWTAYYRVHEIYEWLDHIIEEFPGVVTGLTVGQSYEGRPIRALKISYGTGNNAIVIESHIHAREWISSATATYVINELLRSNDPEIREIAENNDWYIIPVLNPDGLEYTKTDNRMWRKTRRPNAGSTCVGTDANRNYAYNWMQGGASTNPCSETYAGPNAFSESETRTVTDYLNTVIDNIRVYISFHSYGQLILSPWGHTTAQAPNHNHLMEIMEAARTRITAVYGTPYTIGPTAATLYVASGTSHDHFYGEQSNNINVAYTFEFRDTGNYGFILPASQIIPNAIEVTQGLVGFVQKTKELENKDLPNMKICAVFVISLAVVGLAEKVKFNDYKVFTVIPENEDQLKALKDLELDAVASFDFWASAKSVGQKADIMVAPGQMEEFHDFLQENNLQTSLKVEDVQKLIDNERPLITPRNMEWSDYHPLETIYSFLDDVIAQYPGVVSNVQIGSSTEGRPMRGVLISYNQGNPGVFIEANTHAREWITSATATYIINEFLTSQDPEVRRIAESYDWYIFPVVNPDGFVFSHTNNRLWRKTRSRQGLICQGVDPNRNWAHEWQPGPPGASDDICSLTYAGPEAFSEPEVRSVGNFVFENREKIQVFLSFHSYGQVLLYPWSYIAQDTPDTANHIVIGNAMADAIRTLEGTEYEVKSSYDLYEHSGTAIDYTYGTAGVKISWTFEFRDQGTYGFVLPARFIIPNAIEALRSLPALLDESTRLGYITQLKSLTN